MLQTSFAQELPAPARQQLESWAEAREEEPEDDALVLQLVYWQKHPLNLNSATADELELFPFLTPLQVHHFLKYRTLLGPLVEVHELQSIPSWNVETIRLILPYVQVQPLVPPFKMLGARLRGGDRQLLLRTGRVVQRPRGYTDSGSSRFAGGPMQVLARYQYRHAEGLQWGITAEKDAGENFLKKGTPAPDYLSAHVFVRRIGKIKALALGDFAVNLGQGLVHWQSLAFDKGPMVLGIKRQSPVLRPHTGAGEARFLRGAAITLGGGRWEGTFFAAAQKIEANTDVDTEGWQVITSFPTGGLHRTAAEQAQRKAAAQQVLGGNVQYRGQNFSVGFNSAYYHFSVPVQKQPEPYNLFAMQGRNFLNFGTDYSFTWRNLHLFGEVALNEKGKPAAVQGALLSVHPQLDLALHSRLLHRAYTAPAGQAFAESSTPANEQGVYAGMQLRPHPQVVLSAYADAFRFPWLRYRVAAPAAGRDYLVQAQYQPAKGTMVYVRYRSVQKEQNFSEANAAIPVPMPFRRSNLRLHAGHDLGPYTLRSRAEMVWFQQAPEMKKETGFLWYAEVQYPGTKKLGATARLSFFETGSYNTRVYAYESDVLYGYSIPALWDKGLRGYCVLQYRPGPQVRAWLRVAHSFFKKGHSIGTGPDHIAGNGKTELKCQLQVSF